MKMTKIGKYAFMVGILLAIILGLVPMAENIRGYAILVLVVLGLIVGLLNVTAKETTEFLVAAIALIAAGNANLTSIPAIGIYVQYILTFIVVFVAPAALVVALRAVQALAKD
jgi:hypothetical protein